MHGIGRESKVLFPERAIESQDSRSLGDFRRRCLRVNKDVERIADRIHAGEDEQRHRDQHEGALQESSQDEFGHWE